MNTIYGITSSFKSNIRGKQSFTSFLSKNQTLDSGIKYIQQTIVGVQSWADCETGEAFRDWGIIHNVTGAATNADMASQWQCV